MDSSAYSFIAWAAFMVLMLVGLGVAARRGRARERETEDIASKALPQIGRVAEKAHSQRFGNRPSDARTKTVSWYPPAKTKPAKHA